MNYEGMYYQVHQATILPRSIQQPLPIWISTNTDEHKPKMAERALRRVARYADGVRHLTQDEILLAEKRGTEEMTSGSPYFRRVHGSTWNCARHALSKSAGRGARRRSASEA